MAHRLTDLHQLSRALIRTPSTDPPPAEPSASPVASAALSRDEADVLAYFRKDSSGGATARPVHRPPASKPPPPSEESPALARRITELESLLAQAQADCARLARELEDGRTALQGAQDECERLRKACARLEADLHRTAAPYPAGAVPATGAKAESAAVERPARPTESRLLKIPPRLVEAFPGELREMALTALAEAHAAALQAGRDRRAVLLAELLASNPPSGELERRRAVLRQVLKDAGSFNDTHVLAELAKLGLRPISGRKHWKLDYGGLRLTMAKTPSDHRSQRNAAAEIGNRCY